MSCKSVPAVERAKLLAADKTRFGSWVVEGVGPYHQRHHTLVCRCDCDYVALIQLSQLESGRARRCGSCAAKARRAHIPIGEKFGSWTVVEAVDGRGKSYRLRCRCVCGTEMLIARDQLLKRVRGKCRKCADLARFTGIDKSLWSTIVLRAEERELELTVTWDGLKALLEAQNYRCALTGVPIILAKTTQERRDGKTTASLDRINSDKGYVPGNVQWVHKQINWTKHALDDEAFIALCCSVAAHSAGAIVDQSWLPQLKRS